MRGGVARCLLVLGLFGTTGSAAPILFVGSQPPLSAAVEFKIVGTDLIVTLTNTSLYDVVKPEQVLTAVFFDLGSTPALTPVSAVLNTGSVVLFNGTDPGGVVGGEWAYRNSLSGAPGGATYGISSVGLGLFGEHDLFPGANLQGPESPNGLQYGITSAGDDPATGNAPVTGDHALIQNSVVFTLGLPPGFGDLLVSNVWVQYGTSLREPSFPLILIPEPGTWVMLVAGLTAILAIRRRSRRGQPS